MSSGRLEDGGSTVLSAPDTPEFDSAESSGCLGPTGIVWALFSGGKIFVVVLAKDGGTGKTPPRLLMVVCEICT